MKSRYLMNFSTVNMRERATDVVVVGGGIAGVVSALTIAENGHKVILLLKEDFKETGTYRAQGGIAAALGKDDSAELHRKDTLLAGNGLCRDNAVDILVQQGPKAIQLLQEWGVMFDQRGEELAFTREGCHSRNRILHAGGDETGRIILEALYKKIRKTEKISLSADSFAIDILTRNGRCEGILYWQNQEDKIGYIRCKTVILATGGAGQLYSFTTNPSGITGDGAAMAWRAGAVMKNPEFFQFHPTVLAVSGNGFLISEAVRGEGGILCDEYGNAFMSKYHCLMDLAPRNVVAKSIYDEMEQNRKGNMFLDVSMIGGDVMWKRFPSISEGCKERGIDVKKDLIPIVPGAHYWMGGVETDLWGCTNIPYLLAVGETACNGIHGANRLASNSLLEGVVFGRRVGEMAGILSGEREMEKEEIIWEEDSLLPAKIFSVSDARAELQQSMLRWGGIVRREKELCQLQLFLKKWTELHRYSCHSREEAEFRNMLTIGGLFVAGALQRKESRGSHYRDDYPMTGTVKKETRIKGYCV